LNIVINLRRKQLDGLVIYKYSSATSTQASSTSTSTRPSSTSTSTSNLYSSTSTSTKYYISGYCRGIEACGESHTHYNTVYLKCFLF